MLSTLGKVSNPAPLLDADGGLLHDEILDEAAAGHQGGPERRLAAGRREPEAGSRRPMRFDGSEGPWR
jgi:hypothetical protein